MYGFRSCTRISVLNRVCSLFPVCVLLRLPPPSSSGSQRLVPITFSDLCVCVCLCFCTSPKSQTRGRSKCMQAVFLQHFCVCVCWSVCKHKCIFVRTDARTCTVQALIIPALGICVGTISCFGQWRKGK